jgi:tetratricopeptide (TPR) repeat protein
MLYNANSLKVINLKFSLLLLLISFTFQFNAFAGTDPKDTVMEEYRAKGYEEQQKGNLGNALTFYSKAVELGLTNAKVYNDLGVLYEQMGIRSKAEIYYLKAVETDPKYLPPYLNLGYLYKQTGNIKSAEKYFIKRYELSKPNDPWAQKAKEELLKISSSYEQWFVDREAKQLNVELTQQAEQEFYDKVNRSNEYFKNGERLAKQEMYKEAVEEFDHALEFTPKSPKILAARDQARHELARRELEEQSNEAVRLIQQGDYTSAQHILTTIQDKPNAKFQ